MTDKEQIIEGVKILATAKSVKKYMRDGCNYSLYCIARSVKMQVGMTMSVVIMNDYTLLIMLQKQ